MFDARGGDRGRPEKQDSVHDPDYFLLLRRASVDEKTNTVGP